MIAFAFAIGFVAGAAVVAGAALLWLHLEARKDGGRYD